MSLVVRVSVAADPQAAWERFADFDRWPEWNPVCIAAEPSGPPQAGTIVRLNLRHPRGRPFWTTPRLTIAEPGRRLAWELRSFGLRAPAAVSFTPDGDHTAVELTADTSGPLAFSYRIMFPEKTEALVWSGVLTGLARSFGGADTALADA